MPEIDDLKSTEILVYAVGSKYEASGLAGGLYWEDTTLCMGGKARGTQSLPDFKLTGRRVIINESAFTIEKSDGTRLDVYIESDNRLTVRT